MESFNITFFTKSHFWWKNWDRDRDGRALYTWWATPDEYSSGGTGFAFRIERLGIGLHVAIHWFDQHRFMGFVETIVETVRG
jgi:hypothetical protein